MADRERVAIGLIGDRSDRVLAHAAIPQVLAAAGARAGVAVDAVWLASDALPAPAALRGLDGIWCTPGSPYADEEAVIAAIRTAREAGVPFLGTCGGFQHALVELARHAAGLDDAAHAETRPDAATRVVAPLACSLAGTTGGVHAVPGGLLAGLVGLEPRDERYVCSFGLDERYLPELEGAGLVVEAVDAAGAVRAMRLEGHPFHVGTLYQPELSPDGSGTHPLVHAFVAAAARVSARREVVAGG